MKVARLSILLALVACTSGGSRVETRPPSTMPVDVRTDSIVETEVFPPPFWTRSHLNVTLRVTTIQSDSSASDTVSLARRLVVAPDAAAGSGQLVISIDPPVQDSLVRDSIRINIEPGGRTVLPPEGGNLCQTRSPELTPVLVRQLFYPTSPRVLYPGTTYADSLFYTNCIRGVEIVVRLEFRWTRLVGDSLSVQVPVSLSLSGEMRADSSRQFPMRLAGRISGTSSAKFAPSTLSLDTLRAEVESTIETMAGERKQQFVQRAQYLVTRGTGEK